MIGPVRIGPRHARVARSITGFTLLELMVTVAVAAIIAVLAAPSFREYILNQRIKNASYDLISSLSLARSEAITRNASVNVVQNTGGWINGWCVTTDTVCGNTNQLLAHEAFNSGISISASGSPATITYGAAGRARTAATVFTVQAATAVTGVTPRYVTLCLSGTARSTTSNSGGC